ncbi:hypothetical protein [Micromonospora tulbaghiae]|uniref:hypothetical protein n=1 Tax=Micromonospora tulbaghiae TaxID=479978 RepID=UPI003EBE0946
MNTHCYVGATDPDRPHLVHARSVLVNGHPSVVLPALAAIWAGNAYDTRALITAILAYDWQYLDPDITATVGYAGRRPVPGVGITLAATAGGGAIDAPEPVTVFPLCHAAHLDVDWIYLIETATATIAVHTDDGTGVRRYPLAGCLPPLAAADRRIPQPCGPQAAGAPR